MPAPRSPGSRSPGYLSLVSTSPGTRWRCCWTTGALLAGAGLWLVGTRRRIEISPDQVTWSPLFEGATTVPFAQIRHVEVPTTARGPNTVTLHLLDGRVLPVSALTITLAQASNYADAHYQETAYALTSAHEAWSAHHRTR